MGEVQPTLEQLAAERFGVLTNAERKLLESAESGTFAYCGPPGRGPNDQENAVTQSCSWKSERQIRAELITWLCADREAKKFVHAKGLTLYCAKIIGKVDLRLFTVLFPLIFFQCCFWEEITLLHSDLLLLSLDGCPSIIGVATKADCLER